ncbi:ABC-type transport auxiliary lipoprotein family protein [Halodesulfovibrio sp.]|jgi:ABC-type uncharacterized transport system auxiliary subunit|uniref:ABC-type transport auxiliary lipoprotein family protein n=1 Tax=Halodesulfovibrio sp. TaxID=1912772 RepID=UPI0025CF96F4|nr:ABC-type transport auxiliary lipoprotein family protein [Halodesulfovibrio sp.]MCT4534062.1 ABC-type transport auxiliary lipoprotein family protein [Halodesulfovibrio sp.]
MRKIIVSLIIMPLLLMTCSGCAFDVGLNPPPPSSRYMLAVATDTPETATVHCTPTVSIERPQANAFLNSTGIALIQQDQKVLYYSKGEWATSLPEMLQNAAIRSLNSTQQVRAVTTSQAAIPSNYNLVWNIEDFYARYTGKDLPPRICITLNCWLIDIETSTPVATTVFSAQRSAPDTGLEPIVHSFNASVAKILAQMNAWVVSHIQNHQIMKMRKEQAEATTDN